MALRISTNVASLNAQKNLDFTGRSLHTSLARLSSGFDFIEQNKWAELIGTVGFILTARVGWFVATAGPERWRRVIICAVYGGFFAGCLGSLDAFQSALWFVHFFGLFAFWFVRFSGLLWIILHLFFRTNGWRGPL